ncbi:MAG TPA: sugar phosphate nucleotidyltransferase [Terriglobales bacterium]|nr:sugar phosphate nucleotidyltransferase [Terriglobales bacterium]
MRTWGVIPAAGLGTRIQPLAFSKELLPVGTRRDGGSERPRAVCEYLLDRMLLAGATRICFVISPAKADIMSYFGGQMGEAAICYAIQQNPAGLCDAIFTALPFLSAEDDVLIGLPDTVWFPENGFRYVPEHTFSFLLFPVDRPELFDAVVTDDNGRVREVQVKTPSATSNWVWGAFRIPARDLANLHDLWLEREQQDQYIGTLVNEYIRRGATVRAVRRGRRYVDVGTLHGYREAVNLLSGDDRQSREQPLDVAA